MFRPKRSQPTGSVTCVTAKRLMNGDGTSTSSQTKHIYFGHMTQEARHYTSGAVRPSVGSAVREPTLNFSLTRSLTNGPDNKSLDASGGSAFRDIKDAAMVE